jgi:hypothetical protein
MNPNGEKCSKEQELNEFYWNQFYENNIKPQIEKKGEAYVEWLMAKSGVVKQVNYLRAKHDLSVVWFQKPESDWWCLYAKPRHVSPHPQNQPPL